MDQEHYSVVHKRELKLYPGKKKHTIRKQHVFSQKKRIWSIWPENRSIIYSSPKIPSLQHWPLGGKKKKHWWNETVRCEYFFWFLWTQMGFPSTKFYIFFFGFSTCSSDWPFCSVFVLLSFKCWGSVLFLLTLGTFLNSDSGLLQINQWTRPRPFSQRLLQILGFFWWCSVDGGDSKSSQIFSEIVSTVLRLLVNLCSSFLLRRSAFLTCSFYSHS